MSQEVRETIDAISHRLMTLGLNVSVTKHEEGGHSYTSDVIQEALLYDIARSLREVLKLLRCPNVARAVRDVNVMGKIARRKLVRRKKPCRSR